MSGYFSNHFKCLNPFNCFRRVNSVQVSEPSHNNANSDLNFELDLGANLIFPRPTIYYDDTSNDLNLHHTKNIFNPSFLESFVQIVKGNDDEVGSSLWTNIRHDFEIKGNNERSRFTPFVSFLIKLTSTENLPNGYHDDQWPDLKENLRLLFNKMEQEYLDFDSDISRCEFISQIIGISEESVITCIDKVKLGYLFMQILTEEKSEHNLFVINTIIHFIEDIGSAKVVFDKDSNRFVSIIPSILESAKFPLRLKFLVKFYQALDSGNHKLYEELLNESYDFNDLSKIYSYDKNTLLQVFILPAFIEKFPEMQVVNMKVDGKDDFVQDILFYAYERLDDRFHKLSRLYGSMLVNGIDGQFYDAVNAHIDELLAINEKVSS